MLLKAASMYVMLRWVFDLLLCLALWRYAGMPGWIGVVLFYQLRIFFGLSQARGLVNLALPMILDVQQKATEIAETFSVPPGLLAQIEHEISLESNESTEATTAGDRFFRRAVGEPPN